MHRLLEGKWSGIRSANLCGNGRFDTSGTRAWHQMASRPQPHQPISKVNITGIWRVLEGKEIIGAFKRADS